MTTQTHIPEDFEPLGVSTTLPDAIRLLNSYGLSRVTNTQEWRGADEDDRVLLVPSTEEGLFELCTSVNYVDDVQG